MPLSLAYLPLVLGITLTRRSLSQAKISSVWATFLGVHYEGQLVLLHNLFCGGSVRLLIFYDLGQTPLPLLSRSPQLIPVGLGLGSPGGVLLAPLLYVLLDPLHDPLDHGRTRFAHYISSSRLFTNLLSHRASHSLDDCLQGPPTRTMVPSTQIYPQAVWSP